MKMRLILLIIIVYTIAVHNDITVLIMLDA